MSDSQLPSKPISAFISFPSPYTQTLLLQALVSTLPSLAISLVPPEDDNPPHLQWADYDLMTFDKPHSDPSYLISSYIYRKALIRKHQLHLTITEYLAKCDHRNIKSVLGRRQGEAGGWPLGWNVEIQFADELDEMWVDELYELADLLRKNEELEESERQWFILKPGFADRAQGIRLFSTQDQLQEIFESFEPDSSDDEDGFGEAPKNEIEAYKQFKQQADKAIKEMREASGRLNLDDDSSDEGFPDKEEEEEDEGTGVMTSQLRHFVIQEYIPRPILFDISQQANDPESAITGFKFHLRAYVLLTGAWTVHLSRTMLALFSGSPYSPPKSGEEGAMDLRPHLTNTCLQTDAYGAPTPPAELVKLFWELSGLNPLVNSKYEDGQSTYSPLSSITDEWLEGTFAKVGEVVAESVKAGVECGSFGLQLMPNAFEIFGVDLLLSFRDTVTPGSTSSPLPLPRVTLLEYNASPDFHQSGNRLRGHLMEMFQGVINISIKPFFKLGPASESGETTEWEVGQEKYGWRLVGKGEIRGPAPT